MQEKHTAEYTKEWLSLEGQVDRLIKRGLTAAVHHRFDRRLRLLVMGGVERIEVAVRMRIGYVLGRASAFAHEDPACFDDSFTKAGQH